MRVIQRGEVFAALGPKESMQLYGRGIRRRLASMLADPRRVRMAYSLQFTLPGTPVLRYGEEIGMGEDLALDGREAIRTPMQWSAAEHGGFSTAPADQLPAPVVEGGYGPEFVNVEAQRRDPDSLLSFISLLMQRYRECPELGWGEFAVLEQPHAQVLAHTVTWDDACLVAVHNLADTTVTVPLVLPDLPEGTRLADLLVDGSHRVAEDGSVEVPLEAYGMRWLRVVRPGDRRLV